MAIEDYSQTKHKTPGTFVTSSLQNNTITVRNASPFPILPGTFVSVVTPDYLDPASGLFSDAGMPATVVMDVYGAGLSEVSDISRGTHIIGVAMKCCPMNDPCVTGITHAEFPWIVSQYDDNQKVYIAPNEVFTVANSGTIWALAGHQDGVISGDALSITALLPRAYATTYVRNSYQGATPLTPALNDAEPAGRIYFGAGNIIDTTSTTENRALANSTAVDTQFALDTSCPVVAITLGGMDQTS